MIQTLVRAFVLLTLFITLQVWAAAQTPLNEGTKSNDNTKTSQEKPVSIFGKYISRENANYSIELRSDGTLSFTNSKKTYNGTFKTEGDFIVFRLDYQLRKDKYFFISNMLINSDSLNIYDKDGAFSSPAKVVPENVVSQIPPGPSMDETKAWLEREVPKLGKFSIVSAPNKSPNIRVVTNHSILRLLMADGRLTIYRSEFIDDINSQTTYIQSVILKDVDVRKIQVIETNVASGYTHDKPSYSVKLVHASDREPFTSVLRHGGNDQPFRRGFIPELLTSDIEGANRIADNIRQAAILCGANQPVGTKIAEPDQKTKTSPAKPVSPDKSKITNDEVIQLVKAGLSEQVVITSIRQAPTKDFDLTTKGLIELKKAGVSDAVILVMQERVAPTQNTSASETKKPSKYDATLADPPKSVAAPAPENGCAGIENMGVFKNQAMATAIGGGIVEWLLKIRNNTTVTKIVIYSYRDSYGGTPQNQVQIRGGEIATIRLDLTKSRFIAPVTDVRIVSCQ